MHLNVCLFDCEYVDNVCGYVFRVNLVHYFNKCMCMWRKVVL